MAETSNKAEMAKKVFEEIFEVFGWERRGTLDRNWACLNPDAHDERSTHPTDIVFKYADPYRTDSVYVNVDLKSYSKDSIDRIALSRAMRSMATATDCLNQSEEWQRAYVDDRENWHGVGMLFIYNNDNLYDESKFPNLLAEVNDKDRFIARGRKMFVMGPGEVKYLYTVAHDIQIFCNRRKCEHTFFYPDLVRHLVRAHEWSAASLEMLVGPWQIVRLVNHKKKPAKETDDYLFYYRGAGKETYEFAYLIDFMLRFQILRDRTRIYLRLPSAHKTAAEIWQKAVVFYSTKYPGLESVVSERLRQVEFSSVTTVMAKFSEIELGME